MTEISHKLAVLAMIARDLNERRVVWAVGASALLYFKNLVHTFHDIDIMVSEADIGAAEDVLRRYGTLQPSKPNERYQTKRFLEFTVNGVEVDVMAGFSIVCDGVAHSFPLEARNIRDHVVLDGADIPLQSLPEWREYYRLMGRTEKVRIIDGCAPEAEGGPAKNCL